MSKEQEKGLWLREDFFSSNEISIIKRQKDGFMYLFLFLKLLDLSAQNDGWLITKEGETTIIRTHENLPNKFVDFSPQQISEGLDLFKSVGLIREVEGVLRISELETVRFGN